MGDPFEAVLKVISNGSFPPPRKRGALSAGQRRQFRDAMHLALHVQYGRDLFVTRDAKAFINSGRRGVLENMLATRIMTPAEAIRLLALNPQALPGSSS